MMTRVHACMYLYTGILVKNRLQLRKDVCLLLLIAADVMIHRVSVNIIPRDLVLLGYLICICYQQPCQPAYMPGYIIGGTNIACASAEGACSACACNNNSRIWLHMKVLHMKVCFSMAA